MAKHEPVPAAKMLDRCEYYTPCEVLREIYSAVSEAPSWVDKKEVMLKLRLVSAMAKAVTGRLYRHEPNYLEELFDKTKDIR